jgi:type IV secretory pathway VirB10-like protein
VGGFGQQSAQAKGKQVDRAGAMDQMQGAAGSVQDYSIKIFFSTWMEPVLRQFVKMEHMYETDQTLLAIAAKSSPQWIRTGESTVSDEYLQQDLITVVDVGMGNTDPVKRIQKLEFGIGMINQLPDMPRRIKSQKVADEIMGVLGYKDASRFYMNDQELVEHMKSTPPPPPPPEVQIKQMELQSHQQLETMRDKRERDLAAAANNLKTSAQQSQEFQGHIKTMTQDDIAKAKDKTLRDVAAAKESNRLAEVNLKRADGARPKPAPAKPPGKGPPK